jgi:hypothetical protein
MLSLTDVFAVSGALRDSDLDVDLRALIGFRAWHMCVEHEGVIGTDVQLFAVLAGDTPEIINGALGFAITGDDAEEPSFLSIEDHGGWFELAYARDDAPYTRIFVENGPGTELGIHYLCQSHFWFDGEGSRR